MPRFLAGCDYNEEDINQHLAKKEKEGYWQVQMNVNKFATSKILKKKPVEVVKGRYLAA
jgi:predicted NodU family carbamoyl transferase